MVEVGVHDRVVEQATGIKGTMLPPRKRLHAQHLGGGLHLLDPCGCIAEQVSTGDGCGLVPLEIKDMAGWPETNDVGREDLSVGLILRGVVIHIRSRGFDHLGHVEIPMGAGQRIQPIGF